jgi:F420H(2)-dependent quinone reductase
MGLKVARRSGLERGGIIGVAEMTWARMQAKHVLEVRAHSRIAGFSSVGLKGRWGGRVAMTRARSWVVGAAGRGAGAGDRARRCYDSAMSTQRNQAAKLPPRWFVQTAWFVHRSLYAITGGRFGLRTPNGDRPGMLRLTTIGRRSGKERSVIVSYVEDGADLVLVAMNGWAAAEPGWWINLQANPEAKVTMRSGTKEIHARTASEEDRRRLWGTLASWSIERYQPTRGRETAVIILEPRPVMSGPAN